MRERGVLRLEQRAIVGAVGDLEDEAVAGRGRQQEILVALAGQRRGNAVDVEQPPAQIRSFVGRQRGCVVEDVHATIIRRTNPRT